ncbi:hypothetical protein [Aeromicrobium sp. CF3.5]|uniref:hypothetical protein n=1 Tax=Aeromicrobium sp. CF3.5 TaxID=3373078 RepID=UPI003EE4F5D4
MRRAATLLAGVSLPVLVLLGGCSGATDESGPDADPAATDACTEVRAGIDAFNTGDFDETVDRFRTALPLAEDQASSDDSQEAADLLEAVQYYADLEAGMYPEAARTSPDFEKYKQITLGQCGPIEQPDPDDVEEPGVET